MAVTNNNKILLESQKKRIRDLTKKNITETWDRTEWLLKTRDQLRRGWVFEEARRRFEAWQTDSSTINKGKDTVDIINKEIIATPEANTRTDTSPPLTLREQVARLRKWTKSREELIQEAREEQGREELEQLRTWFRQEARDIREDIENIKRWLEAEGGAITNIAASRIREARTAPLREQLSSIVKWIEITSWDIEELDSSIDAILEARRLDRQDEITNLSNQIEASNLSREEKNRLQTQLWVQSKRMQQEEELEAFRQKEEIKANLKKQDEESLAKTGLTAQQALESAKIIEDFDVKEDSIAWQSVRKLLKEGKTPQQIRTLLWLSEDKTGKIDDEQFSRQEKLRKEFESNQTVKNYLESTQQFAGVINSLWQATWPWDMAAIFQFMKTLDPTSVVRETEFATAAQSSGILDRVASLQLLNKVATWAFLTPKQRQQFASIAKVLFENRKQAFDERAGKFIRLAKEAWVNPKSVVLDFENIPWIATDLTEDDLEPIWPDSSDEEISNFIRKWWNTFNIDSRDSDIWTFLDEDFNQADQTAWTKDLQSFIKEQEGWFSRKAFDDFNQRTIGFWTRAKPWEITITEEEAEKRFQDELLAIDNKIVQTFWTGLSPWQKTALTSFMFNLGKGIFDKPEAQVLKNAILRGDKETIKQQFVLFNKAWWEKLPWLVTRRKRELEQFFNNKIIS